jgi:hypothetical protein
MVLTETLKKAQKLFPQKQGIVCRGKRFTYQDFMIESTVSPIT